MKTITYIAKVSSLIAICMNFFQLANAQQQLKIITSSQVLQTPIKAEIITNPTDFYVCEDGTSLLYITAIGDAPITFQWLFNGNLLPQTDDTLKIENITTSSSGIYRCIASNGCGSDTSAIANLTVYPKPTSYNINGGGSFCHGGLGVNVGLDNSELGVQYQLIVDGVSIGTPIAGTSSALDFGLQTHTGYYSVSAITSNNCTGNMTGSVAVTENTQITLDLSNIQNATCNQNNGYVDINITGGISPYNILWSNADTGTRADSLGSGIHSVYVTDAANCIKQSFFGLSDSDAPEVQIQVEHASCFGANDGSILAQASGGTSPYTYAWSTGSETNTAEQLVAGTYELILTDAHQCVNVLNAIVNQPSAITTNPTINHATCGNSNGSISVVASGGSGVYFYNWSNANTSSNLSNLSAGIYTLTLNDNHGCSIVRTFTVNNSDGPQITIDSIVPANCGAAGAAYISVSGGTGSYTYHWSNNFTGQDLAGFMSGEYTVTVTGGTCQAIQNITIPSNQPQTQSLCVVTVDNEVYANLIVWEKEVSNQIDYYNVYRETHIANDYTLIGFVPYDDMSELIDSIANPMLRSYKYKVSAVDVCGMESPLSLEHKTIHLNMNLGLNNTINLMWDDYEGFEYQTFYVNRHTNASGWVVLDSLPIYMHSFTDVPPSFGGLWYSITVNSPGACVPTSAARASGGPYYQSTSNLEDEGSINTSVNTQLSDRFILFPNPTQGNFVIEFEKEQSGVIKISTVSGQTISENLFTGQKIWSSNQLLPKGVYLISVTGHDFNKVNKLVVK